MLACTKSDFTLLLSSDDSCETLLPTNGEVRLSISGAHEGGLLVSPPL
jgi:hypothetical protein